MMFKHPGLLWLLTVLVPLVAYYIWKWKGANPTMGMSSLSAFAKLPVSWKVCMMHVVFAMEMGALACVIVALARPQTYDHMRTSRIEGTDIALALDISGSMMANDLEPNRFTVSSTPERMTIWRLWCLPERASRSCLSPTTAPPS